MKIDEHKRSKPFTNMLLLSDMDGTLLNGSSEVSPENLAALKEFTDNGGLFTVATGRSEASVRTYGLPINVPAILLNGAVIYDYKQDKILWESSLEEEAQGIVRDIAENFSEVGIEIFNNNKVYFVRQNEYTEKHKIREKIHPSIQPLDSIPRPWHKILLTWHPERIRELEIFLEVKKGNFRFVSSEPQFLEILNKSVSKGNALKILTEMIGIANMKVVAIGDNLNDLEMIKNADIGIAVGNAHTRLKEAAGFCSRSNNEHAVSDALVWLQNAVIKSA